MLLQAVLQQHPVKRFKRHAGKLRERCKLPTKSANAAKWGPFDLHGKNAIVTGGAMGIGLGISRCLVQAGADVLIVDIDRKAVELAANQLDGSRGRAASFQADITAKAIGEKVVGQCIRLFGSLDILVNNAGIYPTVPVLQMTPDVLDRVYNINLKALVFMSKAAAAEMVKRGKGGKIINISSIDAFYPVRVGFAAYDASKGAVVMFTKSLALELAPYHVVVNSIAPGPTATEGISRSLEGMTKEQIDEREKGIIARIPLGRRGVPDDIGKVAVFLASSASDYITGQTVIVDGGRLLS